jgi:hypothetical protein
MAPKNESVEYIIGKEEPTEFRETQDSDERNFWRNVAKERKRGQIDRTLDGLKQIINLNGVIIGVYFAALSISSLNKFLIIRSILDIGWIIFILGPSFAWLVSLSLSICALCASPVFPHWTNDVDIIKSLWQNEFKSLSTNLARARQALLIGFVLMFLNIAVYIYISCDP